MPDPAQRLPKLAGHELLVDVSDSVTWIPFQFEVVGATLIVAVAPRPVFSPGNTFVRDSGVVPVTENELGQTTIVPPDELCTVVVVHDPPVPRSGNTDSPGAHQAQAQ